MKWYGEAVSSVIIDLPGDREFPRGLIDPRLLRDDLMVSVVSDF